MNNQLTVIGHIIFLMYILLLINVIKKYQLIHFHLYFADGILTYTHCIHLLGCINEIIIWLLKLLLVVEGIILLILLNKSIYKSIYSNTFIPTNTN